MSDAANRARAEATLPCLCECNSADCTLSIELPVSILQRRMSEGFVIVLTACARGPEPTDTLIETEPGLGRYSLYWPR
jgi:hypothetical protein